MVKIGSKELTIIPWRTLEFIEHAPGVIPYSIKMTYGSGKKEGCLNLKKGSIIYIKYKSPFIVTSEGNVSFEDVVTGATDGLEVPCK